VGMHILFLPTSVFVKVVHMQLNLN